MAAFVLQWQSRVVMADTAWLAELKYLLCLFKKKFVEPWSKQSEEVRSVITCFYRRGNRSSESLSKLLKLIRDPAKNWKPGLCDSRTHRLFVWPQDTVSDRYCLMGVRVPPVWHTLSFLQTFAGSNPVARVNWDFSGTQQFPLTGLINIILKDTFCNFPP